MVTRLTRDIDVNIKISFFSQFWSNCFSHLNCNVLKNRSSFYKGVCQDQWIIFSGIKPGTCNTQSQHSTMRPSRRFSWHRQTDSNWMFSRYWMVSEFLWKCLKNKNGLVHFRTINLTTFYSVHILVLTLISLLFRSLFHSIRVISQWILITNYAYQQHEWII